LIGIAIRNIIVSAVYRTSLKLTPAAQSQVSSGKIINQVSTDGQRFMMVMPALFGLITAPLQLVVTIALLLYYLGLPALVGLFILGSAMPIVKTVGSMAKEALSLKMIHSDSRIKTFNEAIQGIKVVKFYAWEEAFVERITVARDAEAEALGSFAYNQAGSSRSPLQPLSCP